MNIEEILKDIIYLWEDYSAEGSTWDSGFSVEGFLRHEKSQGLINKLKEKI